MCETFLLKVDKGQKTNGTNWSLIHENMNDDRYDFLTIFKCFLPSRNILEFEWFYISTILNKLTKNSDGKTLCFEYSRPFPTLFSRISYLTVKFV